MLGRVAEGIESLAWRSRVARYRRKYEVHETFDFRRGSSVYGSGRALLGPSSYIGNNTYLQAAEGAVLVVGHHTRIGPNVRIYTSTGDPDDDRAHAPPDGSLLT